MTEDEIEKVRREARQEALSDALEAIQRTGSMWDDTLRAAYHAVEKLKEDRT